MSEHPMEMTFRTALWRQFGAAIDMLEHAPLGLPSLAVERAPLERPTATRAPTAVRGILVCHLSCAGLARPISLRSPGGGICSPCTLCPRGARFTRGAARTTLYQGRAARISRVHAPKMPHPTSRADKGAGAPARGVSLVREAANQLSGIAALQSTPRPRTCGPVEHVSGTARHSWSLRLGPPCDSR
jgi:hypothetical protein